MRAIWKRLVPSGIRRYLSRLESSAYENVTPLTWLAAIWLKKVRQKGLHQSPAARRILSQVGVLPVIDHYYEPLINQSGLRHSLNEERYLPGIDFNEEEQIDFLAGFCYQSELKDIPREGALPGEFQFHNGVFESGDAEYLYSIIRKTRPRMIIEVGSGQSTLIAKKAVQRNLLEDSQYTCRQICIEPYENIWLQETEITLIRERVECVEKSLFEQLGAGDILFIDSSHMIRPQGDVLTELLQIAPLLRSGVFVHLHDIFTPRDYPASWLFEHHLLWNEQYLLEAFLTFNHEFRIVGALNYLKHRHPKQLAHVFPVLGDEMTEREPGSFWMRRV